MLNIKLPKTRYKKAIAPDYPNLEDRADGMPIPIAYGNLHNIIPVCIHTVDQIYKLAGHAIHAIDEIRVGDSVLNPAESYATSLSNAQFTINATPYLAANTVYWFMVEVDYAANATDYIKLYYFTDDPYDDGKMHTVTSGGVWSAHNNFDLYFKVYGRKTLSGIESKIVDCTVGTDDKIGIRNTALPCTNYRIGQSFLTGASAIYCTRIVIKYREFGDPVGHIRVSIFSAAGVPVGTGEIQVGGTTPEHEIDEPEDDGVANNQFLLIDAGSGFSCDIEGAEKTGATIVDGADMIEDLVINRLGKSSSILEPGALANFKTKRTQEIKAYIESADITFGNIIEKLETSLLFKFLPLHDGTYASTVYEADDFTSPIRPHFFDEHFLSFSMRHDFSAVKAVVKVKYDENPGNNEFKVAEANSDVTRFVYGVEDTLEVETYLADVADSAGLGGDTNAALLAEAYLGMYEIPPLEIKFEIRGYGFDLIPGRDKVRITRMRAVDTSGTLNDVLFRIIKITKKPGTASTEIVAILDTQTY